MTEFSAILTQQVEKLLAGAVDRGLIEALERGKLGTALWDSVTELGLTSALVSEDAGGAGLSWDELSGVFETLGYHAAPIPLGEAMIGAWTLAATGIQPPDGTAIPVDGQFDLDPNSGAVGGSARGVAWAERASHFVAVAQSGKQRFVCLFPSEAATVAAQSSLGRDPRASVTIDGIVPTSIHAAPPELQSGLQLPLALLRASQIAGALSRCLELAIEYANTRVQFGKPIAKFQALQHMMAELACEAAAAKAAAELGLRGFARPDSEGTTAVAKIRCGMAAGKGAAIVHAVHGAIGVTEEHILHYLTRRLWQWRDDAGTEHEWAERLGRRALARPGSDLWPSIIRLSA